MRPRMFHLAVAAAILVAAPPVLTGCSLAPNQVGVPVAAAPAAGVGSAPLVAGSFAGSFAVPNFAPASQVQAASVAPVQVAAAPMAMAAAPVCQPTNDNYSSAPPGSSRPRIRTAEK